MNLHEQHFAFQLLLLIRQHKRAKTMPTAEKPTSEYRLLQTLYYFERRHRGHATQLRDGKLSRGAQFSLRSDLASFMEDFALLLRSTASYRERNLHPLYSAINALPALLCEDVYCRIMLNGLSAAKRKALDVCTSLAPAGHATPRLHIRTEAAGGGLGLRLTYSEGNLSQEEEFFFEYADVTTESFGGECRWLQQCQSRGSELLAQFAARYSRGEIFPASMRKAAEEREARLLIGRLMSNLSYSDRALLRKHSGQLLSAIA